MPPEVERRLAAILSADVVGYSKLMAADEPSTVRTITAYREQIGSLVGDHRGRVVDATGDNALAEFPTALDAVECAVEIQAVLRARNERLPDERRMEFRIGIHLGDVTVEGDRIYGDGVNIAARLQGLAAAGGVCVSGSVHDQVESKLDLRFDDLGEQAVKNISRPVRAFLARLARRVVDDRSSTLRQTERPSIAVLPFANMSSDPEQEFFSDGITEEIITELSRFQELSVVARNTTFQYKSQAVDIRKVGAKLGVNYILEGSVRTAAGRVRVTAQLLDVDSGAHLWAETYERELTPENVFAVQDDVKEKIVATIGDTYGAISRTALAQTRRKAPETLTAYEAVLLARAFFGESSTPEVHLRAREALERAVELEPTYPEAWAWLATTYRDEYAFGYNRRGDSLERASKAVHRALELDSTNQQALVVLSAVHMYRHEMDEFLRVAERAIALNPNSPDLLAATAVYMSWAGLDRGGELAEKALALSPDPPGWFYLPLVFHHYRRGQDEQALEYAQRVTTPGWEGSAGMMRAAAYGTLGRKEDGNGELKKLLERHPNFPHRVREHWLRKVNVPEEVIERIVEGLRLAGLDIPDEA